MPPLFAQDLDHILSKTRNLWEEARGERFFVTGGTGFFGVWLLESFCHINDRLGLGMSALLLTRDAARFAAKCPHLSGRGDLGFVKGDVRDFALPEGDFPYVIHAATEASAKLNDEAPEEMLSSIVDGTRRVLNLAAQAGAKKFLLTSSGAVYGRQPRDMTHIPEDYAGAPDPLLTASAYGEGKRVSEHMCAVHASRHGYETKIARCFAFVGPHLPLDTHFAIGNFIRDAMAGGPIRVAGDGTPFRSYLYAADLAVWLWTILFRGSSSRAYNVGSDEAISIGHLASKVAEAVAPSAKVSIALPPPPEGAFTPPSRYVPDARRAQLELNLHQIIPLPEALRRTATWTSGNSIH
jgi:nucleoside-diphosphate-sugar epimerase